MLESAEIGHRVSKEVYAREEPELREALLNAQYDLSQSSRGPALLIISGVEGGGRGETANKLTEWMDPRHIRRRERSASSSTVGTRRRYTRPCTAKANSTG
jgi:polyphosphate kinase 2 (PPK2 family)